MSWWAQSGATSYTATFYKEDGSKLISVTTAGTQASTLITEAGNYTVRVKAQNQGGDSAESQAATIRVHAPSTVTFMNYDGTEWSRQQVAYGESAVAPATPSRQGYSFTGWSGSLYNVTSDCSLTASFSPIGYTVTFLKRDGTTAASTQTVYYDGDTPGSAVPPDGTLLGMDAGEVLAGWDTDEYLRVTRNLTVTPCVVWGNEDIPITTTINTVTQQGDGYWVDYTIANHVDAAHTGRVVVVMKSCFGKFITKTESGAFYLAGNGSYTGNLYVPLTATLMGEDFTIVEAYVVDSYSALTPISQVAQKTLLKEGDDSDWSQWMTAEEYAAYTGDKTVSQTRTEYRSNAKSYSDWTTNTEYMGWERCDTRTIKSDYGSWGPWQDGYIASNANTNVSTQQVLVSSAYTQYRYGRYKSTDCSKGTYTHFSDTYARGKWGGTWYEDYSPWSTTQYNPDHADWSARDYYDNSLGNGGEPYVDATSGGAKMYHWKRYDISGSKYFWEYSRVIPAVYKTQYRSQTRTDITQYRYSTWLGWSGWSTAAATASSELQVETRTMYRVKQLTAAGDAHTISGTVGSVDGIGGRQAILAIYRVDGASDYTNEYLAQTTLGADGSYSFTGVRTYDEPSAATGDFTATLTVEGSSGPMFIDTGDIFKAPKPQYNVTFVDELSGQQLGEVQAVTQGEAAVAPQAPDKTGYTFLGWDYGLTNIRDNMIIKARYVPNKYTVIFVDWANSTLSMQTDVPYGTAITVEDPEPREGYIFTGWQAENGADMDCVTGSMVVTAQYEKMSYTVRFLDAQGELLSQQTVLYGEAAIAPESVTVSEGQYMDGWSTDRYTCVTETVDIMPVVYYEEDATAAVSDLLSGSYDGPQTMTLSCDDPATTITYSINDGAGTPGGASTELSVTDMEYTQPITVDKSMIVEVTSSAAGKNSLIETYEFVIVPADARPAAPESLSAEADAEKVTLTWPTVAEADGYVIDKSDLYGQTERFMTESSSYQDSNVLSITSYSYTVNSYANYSVGSSQTVLMSSGEAPETSVTFYGDKPAVSAISIDVGATSIDKGAVVQLYATTEPVDAYNTEIVWSVTPGTGSATVTTDGVLTATKTGSFTLVATAADGGGARAELEMTVTEPSTDVTAIRISSATVQAGGSPKVSVSIDESSNAAMLQFALLYDSTKLSVTDAVSGAAMAGQDPTINFATPGVIYFSWDATRGLAVGGSLMDITFSSTAQPGETLVLYIPQSDEDYDFICMSLDGDTPTDISSAVYNGKISILNSLLGDINGDGKINVIDANMVRRYSAQLLSLDEAQMILADVSGDGKVNIIDANYLRRYSAHIIDSFPA